MQFQMDNNAALVRISGKFTFTDHTAFRALVSRLFEAKDTCVVIDLAKVEFIDSAGLGMLLLARDEAIKTRRKLVLRGPHGQVKNMFDVTKFGALFSVEH
jgi:HptB-dependent secretion and biofilm anti anti-sigma factor